MPNKMKELRHTMHLTQAEVANILKIPVSTYQQYETEKRACPQDVLMKIAAFYDVSIDELLLRKSLPQSRYIKVSADEHTLLSDYRASNAHDKRIVYLVRFFYPLDILMRPQYFRQKRLARTACAGHHYDILFDLISAQYIFRAHLRLFLYLHLLLFRRFIIS